MTLGEFIYKKRLLNKVTVREFAKILQVDVTFVYLIENNLLLPSQMQINVMEDIFSLSNAEMDFLVSAKTLDFSFPKSLVDNLPVNKNPISAIRIPLGLNLNKKQWNDVTEYFYSCCK